MKVQEQRTANSVRFTITGDLDAACADKLRHAFAEAVESNAALVELDLTGLDIIDSAGTGAIINLYKQLIARGRELLITGLNGQPRVVFEILGLDRRFDLCTAA